MPHLFIHGRRDLPPQADPWSTAHRVLHDLRRDGLKIQVADGLLPDAAQRPSVRRPLDRAQ
ncbi:MAG TPA: hypothetical protein VGA04_15695 [Streptosporangiaceae bacterium]